MLHRPWLQRDWARTDSTIENGGGNGKGRNTSTMFLFSQENRAFPQDREIPFANVNPKSVIYGGVRDKPWCWDPNFYDFLEDFAENGNSIS